MSDQMKKDQTHTEHTIYFRIDPIKEVPNSARQLWSLPTPAKPNFAVRPVQTGYQYHKVPSAKATSLEPHKLKVFPVLWNTKGTISVGWVKGRGPCYHSFSTYKYEFHYDASDLKKPQPCSAFSRISTITTEEIREIASKEKAKPFTSDTPPLMLIARTVDKRYELIMLLDFLVDTTSNRCMTYFGDRGLCVRGLLMSMS